MVKLIVMNAMQQDKEFELKNNKALASITAHTQCGFQRFCKFSSRWQVLYRLIVTKPRNPALRIVATVSGNGRLKQLSKV
jgi:hypothetical protein